MFCAADFGPYGRRRDRAVATRLAARGQRLRRVGSPYTADPGTVVKADGTPYRVFTPFYRAWLTHLDPETGPATHADWLSTGGSGVPVSPEISATLPEASEAAAHQRLDSFLAEGASGYHHRRDFPAEDGTSRLSPYLKFGLLHPDQVLARLDEIPGEGGERFRTELAWREFYADVVWHHPTSARVAWEPALRGLRTDHGPEPDHLFAAWAAGRTGYPLVDAGMRQLLAEGWMHNRVRMVAASFLVKDLHLPWERGARHFLAHLVDGDLASNNHGWQWVAGSSTDAAPFLRIFNPVAQSRRWDPDGEYIRRFVPELEGLGAPEIHQPQRRPGYPPPIVDHAVERLEALARYAATSRGRASAKKAAGPR